ncbi:MAG: HAD-IC family P-type ATPase [Actinobacteria bacterium]|nr:HAD-IC family P-type ATPase [Actinomycetota bacterium]MBU4489171.1 HAD-IC family P-type ATPase [Actinomycetota bacterium]
MATEGLSAADVAERIAQGRTNAVQEPSSRSLVSIIRGNVFTRFNAILGVLFVVIVSVGHLQDALFGIVLVVNTLIGIVQELRAKRTLDRLSLLSAPKARVVREGELHELPTGEVVADDVTLLRPGDQVVADGVILAGRGLEIDESLLTGESVPINKTPGDEVFSGSFVVAGTGRFRATGIGADAYATKLAFEARRFQLASSELRDGINLILRYITWLMIPAGGLLLLSQLRVDNAFGDAVSGTVAGLVGMVPEGLVLLTSVAFALSVIVLGRRNVLVQELPAVEGLARVDVICLDKTGTLTSGDLELRDLEALDSREGLKEALGAFCADPEARNATLEAIAKKFPPPPGWQSTGGVPFSSIRKWSAVSFGPNGTWVLGAPEVLLEKAPAPDGPRGRVDELASSGLRVLLLARAGEAIGREELPDELEPAALLTFEESVRPDARETLGYFTDQGVTIKVISGDNPVTVAAVARRAGVPDVGEPCDARQLAEEPEEIASAMEGGTVFGRVSPGQKKSMVDALQSKGHVVAMTGDGVNDVLALKKADVGIAIGSGAAATRAVAELVLLDGRFATLPGVVAEGRRVIGNMERVANLFITKTAYATLLSIIIGLLGWTFILLPRHLTVIGALTIGIPAFVLSFEPNKQRYRPGFVKQVLRFTVPVGAVAAGAALAAGSLAHTNPGITVQESRTLATLVLVAVGLWVLVVISRPLNLLRGALVVMMACGLVVVMSVPWLREFFALDLPAWPWVAATAVIAMVACAMVEVIWRFERWWPAIRSRSAKAA